MLLMQRSISTSPDNPTERSRATARKLHLSSSPLARIWYVLENFSNTSPLISKIWSKASPALLSIAGDNCVVALFPSSGKRYHDFGKGFGWLCAKVWAGNKIFFRLTGNWHFYMLYLKRKNIKFSFAKIIVQGKLLVRVGHKTIGSCRLYTGLPVADDGTQSILPHAKWIFC